MIDYVDLKSGVCDDHTAGGMTSLLKHMSDIHYRTKDCERTYMTRPGAFVGP